MNLQLPLSDSDRQLLLDLLQTERQDLPSEIRRTDTPRVHDDLQVRLQRVDDLIEKLEHASVAPA